MLVVVAPGQGAQVPGFLTPWLNDRRAAERIRWLSAVCDLDLAEYGTRADEATIRDTAIAQPLLVAAGLVAFSQLFPNPAERRHPDLLAGHSVGEVTVAAGAGVLNDEQAMVFVRERGREMARVAAKGPTGMAAVLGGDATRVRQTLDRHGLTAANNNGPGQVVAAGTLDALHALAADPPPAARVVPLRVAGAFHTSYVADAVEPLAAYARGLTAGEPRVRLLSNLDGRVVGDPADVLDRIVHQVCRPVRWDLCLETMADLGVTGLLELPPAGTLTGIARRALKGVETFALKAPDQLDEARAFVRRHGAETELGAAPPTYAGVAE